MIDNANRKVVILPASEEGNTVSKRNAVNPVLDTRNKEAMEAFRGCDYLQVDIFNEQIVVSGYVEKDETLLSKTERFVSKFTKSKQKVRDITDLLQVKKKFEVVLSKRDLASCCRWL